MHYSPQVISSVGSHLFHICRHNVILLLISSSDRLRLTAAPGLRVPDDIRGSCLTGAGKTKQAHEPK